MCQTCIFNLPIFVASIFVTFACHFKCRVNWHAKSRQSKSIAKIGIWVSKKFASARYKSAKRSMRKNWRDKSAKKLRTKIGKLNLQEKAESKFADLVCGHKNKWSLMLTKCAAHAARLLWDPHLAERKILILPFFCTSNVPLFARNFFSNLTCQFLQCFYIADFWQDNLRDTRNGMRKWQKYELQNWQIQYANWHMKLMPFLIFK